MWREVQSEGCVRALTEVGVDARGTAPGAAPGMSEIIAEGVGGVSASTAVAGDGVQLPADGSSRGPRAPVQQFLLSTM